MSRWSERNYLRSGTVLPDGGEVRVAVVVRPGTGFAPDPFHLVISSCSTDNRLALLWEWAAGEGSGNVGALGCGM